MSPSDQVPVIKVLFAMHPGMDALDFVGPLEVLNQAMQNAGDATSKSFNATFVAAEEQTVSSSGAAFRAHLSPTDALKRLSEFDILVIPGGAVDAVLKSKTSHPLPLITAFSDLQKKDPCKERTLLAISSGSMLLAQQGILSGLSATTHQDYFAKMETLNGVVAQRDLSERCDVVEERYVVNNLRFDLGENPEENPYVRRKSDANQAGRRPSYSGRKGSISWKESNTRRESNARRASLRLGGLRVITTGAGLAGVDAALYLVSIMVSEEAAGEIQRTMGYDWRKGIVVDGIDI